MDQAQEETKDQAQEEKSQEELEEALLLEEEKEYALLDDAIEYKLKGFYPDGLTTNQKRSVRRKAKTISVEYGEFFIMKKNRKVSVLNVYCWSFSVGVESY